MEEQIYGLIVEFDEKNQTGVIEAFNGERAIFHVNDLATISKEVGVPRIGQNVLFSLKESDLGRQAYNIQIVG